ncbi:MAG: exo-alpha-sialidase, partial [Actinobacteria bacterium]|nr:exo-alpha-sialidase [Actinomycetota bacterium]
MDVLLVVGTRKGLFLIRESGNEWQLEEPLLPGWQINHAVLDPRDGSLYACTNSWVYGGTVHRSTDLGKTWERSEELGLPEESGLKLASTWHLEPGHPSQPDTLWLGGEPGVLFRSDDSGATWAANEALLGHETRERWAPGAGGLVCHSIALDPGNAGRLWIGISAAGVFRSEDGGESFEPANAGTEACFLPDDPFPEVGQCVHKVLAHPARPERLWQQNHCGVYRSDDAGASWERLDENGLPSPFGFALALDPADPDVAYVIPEEGAENRVTSDGRLGIYRTGDAGASWTPTVAVDPAWAAVLREGMSFDADGGVYAGTQSGFVYALRDGQVTEAARHLPPILSVEA